MREHGFVLKIGIKHVCKLFKVEHSREHGFVLKVGIKHVCKLFKVEHSRVMHKRL
jgi:tRNA splicing endonuclease